VKQKEKDIFPGSTGYTPRGNNAESGGVGREKRAGGTKDTSARDQYAMKTILKNAGQERQEEAPGRGLREREDGQVSH